MLLDMLKIVITAFAEELISLFVYGSREVGNLNIWGLFDDGNGCYRQAVDEYNVNMGGATHNNINRNWRGVYKTRFIN